MSDETKLEEYPDKALVSFAKNPSILSRIFKSQPEKFDEVFNHFNDILSNVPKNDKLITIELHMEERTKAHDPVDFECSPKWTVLSTKIKICEKFQTYKINNLYVLHKRSIAKDWVYLKDCGVEQNSDVLYVYVYVPKSVIAVATPTLTAHPRKDMAELAFPQMNLPFDQVNLESLPNISPGLQEEFNSITPENLKFTDPNLALPNIPDGGNVGKLWTCKVCTFLNEEWRPGCCMCSSPKPAEDLEVKSALPPVFPLTMPENNLENVFAVYPQETEPIKQGWRCPKCTFLNEPTRPGCRMCSDQRPADYKVPENYVPSEEEHERIEREKQEQKVAAELNSLERRANYNQHIAAEDRNIIQSVDSVECAICFVEADPENTIVLRECLHRFCKDCIMEHVKTSEEAVVTCPFMDDDYKCNSVITHREIKALLKEEDFHKYLNRGLMQAEKESPNSFHCKTPDCQGWCVYEDQVNTFNCPVCKKSNCLVCKAIHEGKNCKEYQDELMRKAATDEEAKKTKKVLDKMVKDGEAMHCPQCNIIIQKKVGCDWIRCPMCKLEICWVTKGPRWGPKGRGDTSGGCRCNVVKKCHKNCNNCH